MKKHLLFIICCLSFHVLQAQNLNFPNWMIQGSTSKEKLDKRALGYPDLTTVFASQPEEWGTYHYRLTVSRKIYSSWKLTAYMGLGANYERTNLLRPFDHLYFGKDNIYILYFSNKYKKIQINTPLQFYYTLAGSLLLKFEAYANWMIYRYADHTAQPREGSFPYAKSEFELESVELLSGLSLKINRIMFGADVRVLNFQKIDRVLASSRYEMDKTMEWHNPLLFQFSVGYFFGEGAQKPTLK